MGVEIHIKSKHLVVLNENNEVVVPARTPAKLKAMLGTQEFLAALMYRDIGFE
jgi:hypothetical protein